MKTWLRSRTSFAADREADTAMISVLHGIVEKIDQNLAHSYFISVQHVRQIFIHIDRKIQPFFFCLEISDIA